METQLTVVSTEYVQLTFDYISCVTAARSGSIVTSLDLLPVILLDIKDVYIVHPVGSIVSTEVVDL